MAGGGGDDLKLQGPWASPHVLQVRLALGLKGVSYHYVEEQDLNKDSIELLLQSTRPVLVHGGEPVRGTSLNMRRRGLRRRRPFSPPRRALQARRRSLFGGLHR